MKRILPLVAVLALAGVLVGSAVAAPADLKLKPAAGSCNGTIAVRYPVRTFAAVPPVEVVLIPPVFKVSRLGGLTLKLDAFEMTPPGLETVTLAVPGAAMSLAGIEAVSRTLPAKFVVRADPFQSTSEPVTKFEPFTVRTKPGFPAAIEVGLRLVRENAAAESLIFATNASLRPPRAAWKGLAVGKLIDSVDPVT